MTSSPTNQYRIAAIGGDGIGPEVVAAAIEVLDRLATATGAFSLAWTVLDWNSARYLKEGSYLPDNALDRLRAHDAILFGAVGSREVPDHDSLWGLRLAICQGLDQYANVRPTRVLPGMSSPLRNAGGTRLGDRARELGGRVFRPGRTQPSRGTPRDRHRGLDLHADRGRTHPPLRLRARPFASRQAPDAGYQVQCPAFRHGTVGRGLLRGRSRLIRT